jgi:uncharacterized protein
MLKARSRFVWYELMTTDMEGAATFYSSVVGWQTADRSQPCAPYALFTVGGISVCGLMDISAEARRIGARPSWIGYIGTDDVGASADRIERRGGTVLVPPTEISNVSRFSVVADPQGAPVGLLEWLLPSKAQESAFPTVSGVRWHELLTRDGEAAFRFYSELFGWQKAGTAEGDPAEYHLLSMGGETLGAIFGQRGFIGSAFWLYYFVVADIDQAAERVAEGGGKVLEGPTEIPGESWAAHCTDPQGGMFALMGKRSRDTGRSTRVVEATWSSQWAGLSLKGRLRIRKRS